MKLMIGLMLGTALAFAQCSETVIDHAKVFTPEQVERLKQAAQPLINEGFNPHVVTLNMTEGHRIDTVERSFEQWCPDWKSASGGRLNTLIVFALAPKADQTGIFPGHAFDPIGDAATWTRVRAQQMNPRFRDHDWTGGLIAGMNQTAKIVADAQSEHHGTVINNQAVDYSGVWEAVLIWLACILGAVGLVWLALLFVRKKSERKVAQTVAITARNIVSERLTALRKRVDEYAAAGGRHKDKVEGMLGDVLERYNRWSTSATLDPTDSALTTEQYRAIKDTYCDLNRDISKITPYLSLAESNEEKEDDDEKPSAYEDHYRKVHKPNYQPQSYTPPTYTPPAAQRPTYVPTPTQPASARETSDSGFLTGFVVGDVLGNLGRESGSEEQHTTVNNYYETRRDDDSSSNNDSFGGFGSDSSSSSSYSDNDSSGGFGSDSSSSNDSSGDFN